MTMAAARRATEAAVPEEEVATAQGVTTATPWVGAAATLRARTAATPYLPQSTNVPWLPNGALVDIRKGREVRVGRGDWPPAKGGVGRYWHGVELEWPVGRK